ncbi:Phospholipase, partial [Diplonema papillatum]
MLRRLPFLGLKACAAPPTQQTRAASQFRPSMSDIVLPCR